MANDKMVSVTVSVQANPSEGGTLFSFTVPAMLSELLEPGAAAPGVDSMIAFLVKAKNTVVENKRGVNG